MRSITLNGVKLLVYQNGMILRYSSKNVCCLKIGWNLINGSIDTKGYNQAMLNGKTYMIHRLIGFAFLELDLNDKKQQIDHIDRNKQNNHLKNLRIVSNQQNQWNKNIKGYSLFQGKYKVEIKLNNKRFYLGRYDTEDEARQAYLDAKALYHIIPEPPN